MQRPVSPVFGRARTAEFGPGVQRGRKITPRARNPVAIGDPIEDPEEDGGSNTQLDGPVKIAEKLGKHIEVLEKSVESTVKKIRNLQIHLHPPMKGSPDMRKTVSQMLSSYQTKINFLTDQLRSLDLEGETRSIAVVVRPDVSPIRSPERKLCSSPTRKLQTWRH